MTITTLIKPIITEKSMLSASRGLYTFEVLLGSTKSQIKQAINTAFNVHVVSINALRRHVPAKGTGSKRLMGNASQQKFATVRLSKGQSIDLFDLKEAK
ncbi:MAG: 50S ribosomal protein L23 [bacterium]